ncbi:hypothetical protein P4114_28970 [Pseudomonas aeruginosa]|nr:hypothetical protein [Pseudomonas aeruginosa]
MAGAAADPTSISAITVTTNGQGQQEYSVSLQILLIMTALSFIPAFVMLMTSFTRIIIVFSILRQALGLQSTPSNQVLVGLALFLTMFVMAPVFDKINSQALQLPERADSRPGSPAKAGTAEGVHAGADSYLRPGLSSACPSAPTSAARRRRRWTILVPASSSRPS